jgi:hypothetical protein
MSPAARRVLGSALFLACPACLLAAAILLGLGREQWAALACACAGIASLFLALALLRRDGDGGRP